MLLLSFFWLLTGVFIILCFQTALTFYSIPIICNQIFAVEFVCLQSSEANTIVVEKMQVFLLQLQHFSLCTVLLAHLPDTWVFFSRSEVVFPDGPKRNG